MKVMIAVSVSWNDNALAIIPWLINTLIGIAMRGENAGIREMGGLGGNIDRSSSGSRRSHDIVQMHLELVINMEVSWAAHQTRHHKWGGGIASWP
jgi:hypothetical protein